MSLNKRRREMEKGVKKRRRKMEKKNKERRELYLKARRALDRLRSRNNV